MDWKLFFTIVGYMTAFVVMLHVLAYITFTIDYIGEYGFSLKALIEYFKQLIFN